jgi:HAMP domain-containing protein
VSSQMNATIRKSSSMDYMFQSVYEAYPGFHWIYMGFQVGLHRSYPWHGLTSYYDPTTRSWYKTAKASPGEIVFTNPYFDASGGGLMISIARTVTMTNGTFIGVVSADLTIGTIREQILDIKLSPSGYAFLINQAKNVVAYPGSLYPNETISSHEPEIPSTVFNSMVSLQQGFTSFTKNGKVHYIAYAPVLASNYSMAVIVPEDEVIGIVDTLTDDINAATFATIALNFGIIVLAAAIAVILGLLIAGKMVNPINSLVKFASRLATMDIKKAQLQPDAFRIDTQLESQNDEIGDLTRAFKSMVVSLQKEKDSEKNKPGNKQPEMP